MTRERQPADDAPPPTPVPARPAPPREIRLAGVSVGVQGVVGVVFAALLLVDGLDAGAGLRNALGQSGYFLIVGAALVAVGIGLVSGRRWARTPAIVAELLLIPVVYSLLGPSKQLVWGIAVGVVVIATFMLLISERSRRWALDLHGRRAP